MKRIFAIIFTVTFFFAASGSLPGVSGNKTINVLILSGSNNHDWKQTTPFLKKMLTESGLFSVEFTEQPDTLKLSDLADTDVIVSNWNSWPDNDIRWPESTEKALLDFIKSGKGFVTFHASTSAFYNWPEFKEISTAAWLMDSTRHGKSSDISVIVENTRHPVTRGMSGFFVHDELWINAGNNKKFEVLGIAADKDTKSQPAVMVTEYGKGKIFHTILGHDVRAMRNSGFQALILRGTEWAATGKVTQTLPQELQENGNTAPKLSWQRTDTTFALLNGKNVIWQYNFNTKHGRPFFHPVYVGKNNITCLSPDDHLWHLGQWFCWKYINQVNYWEYQNGTYRSDGVTKIERIEIIPGPDFSAKIKLEIVYHPVNGKDVLSEFRTISISPPLDNGNVCMDYQFEFKAVGDTVELNRTPVEGEPGGQSWGGYAGLSIRFNQDFMDVHFMPSWEDNKNINGQTGDWLYMGFRGLDGKQTGSQIIIAPDTRREGAAWYSVNREAVPFYYFSPAYLYNKPLTLKKGDTFTLNYRVVHWANRPDYKQLECEYLKFVQQ
ncbi:hypothetical protein D1164_20620 [Mariniphaga sediminis]|uniref:ThuA-like domain-containing protein n=1 Tax=Mariniphaga sediminis TaxID=1628158 RepID=A0A399CWA4_9BACT|nr:DUF6807 family protein [Mariniphaga sediminis]RIH63258.1 hypothetical protein D1164_20620 [Mariniphaga sediminis]